MNDFERGPAKPKVGAEIESTDMNFSASVDSIRGAVLMKRLHEGDMYELYFETKDGGVEEVAFIGGDTAKAREEFHQATDFLRNGRWKTREEAKTAARDFIVQLHGGIQEAR